MKPRQAKIIYTVLVDDRPVAALETTGNEARELLKEEWFLAELAVLKVKGEPLYKPGLRLRARPATEEEWTVYDRECNEADDADDIEFVYLADLDMTD